MPISKRINNLSLRSQCLDEMDTVQADQHNGINCLGTNYLEMAINNTGIQSNNFASAGNVAGAAINGASYLYNQSPHSHHPHQSHNAHHQHLHNHQSHVDLSNPNGYANGLAIATTIEQQSQRVHKDEHSELNNNEMDETYSPELTADENPFYYSKNKLLFDLHIERERRSQSH